MKNIFLALFLFMAGAASAQYKTVQIPQNKYPENDDVLQRKGNQWVPRSIAQLKVDLDILDSTTVADALGDRVMYVDTSGMLQAYRSADSAFTVRIDSVVNALSGVGGTDTTSLSGRIDLKADQSDLAAHLADNSNPHNVTLSQVGYDSATDHSSLITAINARLKYSDTSTAFGDYRIALNARATQSALDDTAEAIRSDTVSFDTASLGASVATFLTTPSSDNLAAAVAGETGTGALVFATSPTLTTPNLGTPTAITLTNGTGLPQSGVTNLTNDLAAKADKAVSINTQTSSYTGVLADAGLLVRMNNASANNFTVPPNSSVAYPIGTQITVVSVGAGQTTIVAGSGVTINSAGGALKLRVQYSSATLIKTGTDTWLLIGDITT